MKVRVRTDGASRGNPGPSGIGVVIERATDGVVVAEIAEYLGSTTNNVAEYRALIAGLRRALELGATAVEVVSDSELMVRQVDGVYKVRSEHLQPLLREVHALRRRFLEGFAITHTLRGGNQRADELANVAIDEGRGAGRTGDAPAGLGGPGERPRPARVVALPTGGDGGGAMVPAVPGDIHDVGDLLARLPDGVGVALGGGLSVLRLPPAGIRGDLVWVMVLQGEVLLGTTRLRPWLCCSLDGAQQVCAGEEGAVLLALDGVAAVGGAP